MANRRKRINVLVTGVGAIIGYGILKSLRHSNLDCFLVGMDIYDDAYGRHVCDEFVRAQRADAPEYPEFIRSVVATHAIDLIIPGIEQDLYALWGLRQVLPTALVMNNDLCLALSQSKLEAYRYFNARGARFVIPTLHDVSYADCVAAFGSPFLLKLISSYASKGQAIIRSSGDFTYHLARCGASSCILQPIVGTDEAEYTVAAFGDGRGSYFDSIVLRRRLSPEGATVKAAFVEKDDAIRACVDEIFALLEPIGPTNVQLRKDGDRVYLLEVNPRISSACSLRTAFGYNEPEMCVRHFVLKEALLPAPKRSGNAVRFIDDLVVYD